MDIREIGWGGMGWIDLAQDRDQWRALVSTVMNLRVPSTAGQFLSSCTTGGFSRRAQLREVSFIKNILLKHTFSVGCSRKAFVFIGKDVTSVD
jgi:hypothetical protein